MSTNNYLLGTSILCGTNSTAAVAVDNESNFTAVSELETINKDLIKNKTYNEAEQSAQIISKRVSPWLWVFSIIGFSFSIWSKYQINQLYRHNLILRK